MAGAVINSDRELARELSSFLERLNVSPPPKEVQMNKYADGSRYLPISFVQMNLDELFFGLWSWEITDVKVVANEILVWGNLKALHPVSNTWITRSGTGAAMIQQKSGSAIDDISAKIKNTISKDLPHAEAEALKNAAKKLGRRFGRDLNRGFADDFVPPIDAIEADEEFREEVEQRLKDCSTIAQLKNLMQENTQWQSSDWVLNKFSLRKAQIEKK